MLQVAKAISLNVIGIIFGISWYVFFIVLTIPLDHKQTAHDFVEEVALDVVEDEECQNRFDGLDGTSHRREPREEAVSFASDFDLKLIKLNVTNKGIVFIGLRDLCLLSCGAHLKGLRFHGFGHDSIFLAQVTSTQVKGQGFLQVLRQIHGSIHVHVVFYRFRGIISISVHILIDNM